MSSIVLEWLLLRLVSADFARDVRQEQAFVPNIMAKVPNVQNRLTIDSQQEFVAEAVKTFDEWSKNFSYQNSRLEEI